jgi:hypothetical protein
VCLCVGGGREEAAALHMRDRECRRAGHRREGCRHNKSAELQRLHSLMPIANSPPSQLDHHLARTCLSTMKMFLRASSTVPRPCSRCTASSSSSAMAVSRGLSPTCLQTTGQR